MSPAAISSYREYAQGETGFLPHPEPPGERFPEGTEERKFNTNENGLGVPLSPPLAPGLLLSTFISECQICTEVAVLPTWLHYPGGERESCV